ncbi:MAG: major facilitator superfamily 1, partial [Nocardioides sp.]|nr:major facilitator superfamily 1 [Nocardioides sp.]
STDGDVAQPDSAIAAITLGFSILPAVLVILSLWWLRRYSLDAAEVDVISTGSTDDTGSSTTDTARPTTEETSA